MAVNTISGQAAATGQVTIPGHLMPAEGARAIGFALDFVNFQTNIIDFTYAYENTNFKEVMGLFVDNSTNPQPLTIQTNQPPQQNIVVPPYAQGVFSVIAPIRSKFTVSTTGNQVVDVIFTNIPLSNEVWYVQTPGTPTTPTNFAIVTPGLAVNPWPGKHVTAGGFIYNPTSNGTTVIYVDFVNTAEVTSPGTHGTTVDLVPGDSIPIPTGFIAVTVNSAAAVPFVAYGQGVV